MANDDDPVSASIANPGPTSDPPGSSDPSAADEPVTPSRKRWIAAAAAALGVALFAVPFIRGPVDEHTGAGSMSGSADAPAAGACQAKGSANLDFTLKDASGARVNLADYKGKVVLLNFWATWCGPCKVEIPEFVDAYAKYRDKGFVILGVLSEDDPSAQDLKAFMDTYKMNYPVLREDEGLEQAFGDLYALPTSFIIDRQGSICTKHMGPISAEMLERELERLL